MPQTPSSPNSRLHTARQSSAAPPHWLLASLALLALGLIGQRLIHLTAVPDEPHSFRQCETAYFAWAFYETGIDLLHPSVNFLGNHRTLVLEFPISEAITAAIYHLLGPRFAYAQLTTLLFFLGATYYLAAIVARVSTRLDGILTAVVYLALPLGLFYSRAVDADFSAVFFAHLMTYCFVRGYDERAMRWWLAGSIAGALAFAIKPNLVFYLCLPCLYYVLSRPEPAFLKRGAFLWVIPVVAFVLWRNYANRVNANAPDWFFLPGYMKFVDSSMGWYYYGPLSLRLEGANWFRLGYRMLYYVASPIGCITSVLGLLMTRRSQRASVFFVFWLLGAVLCTLIFFKLNIEHDYYSIPFLPVIAFFTARFLATLLDALYPRLRALAWLPVSLILLALVTSCVWLAETSYYRIDWIRVKAGEIIKRDTPPGSLIIVSSPETVFLDPRLLYLSKRNGWSVDESELAPGIVEALRKEGAQYIALLYPAVPLPDRLKRVLEGRRVRTYEVLQSGPRVAPRRFRRWLLALAPLEPASR